MFAQGPFHKIAASFVAIAMLGSSASAAPVAAPRMVDPLAVVSVFGTSQSLATICAGSSAAATAGSAAAAAGQAPGAGCVLPVVDAPPPPVVEAPPPELAPVVPASGSIGALPFLVGLAAIVGFAAIVLKHENDNGVINLPISP